MHSYPIVENVTLSLSDISDKIYQIIAPIRPDWNQSNTRLAKFTEGITNAIFGLFDSRTGDDQSKALVIKLFGAHTELFIDRQSEINAMVKLSKHGVLSQRVLVQLQNGLGYEYAPGEACSRDNVRKENIAQLIATKLAQFHCVPVEEYGKPYVILLLRRFLQIIKEDAHQSKGSTIVPC